MIGTFAVRMFIMLLTCGFPLRIEASYSSKCGFLDTKFGHVHTISMSLFRELTPRIDEPNVSRRAECWRTSHKEVRGRWAGVCCWPFPWRRRWWCWEMWQQSPHSIRLRFLGVLKRLPASLFQTPPSRSMSATSSRSPQIFLCLVSTLSDCLARYEAFSSHSALLRRIDGRCGDGCRDCYCCCGGDGEGGDRRRRMNYPPTHPVESAFMEITIKRPLTWVRGGTLTDRWTADERTARKQTSKQYSLINAASCCFGYCCRHESSWQGDQYYTTQMREIKQIHFVHLNWK